MNKIKFVTKSGQESWAKVYQKKTHFLRGMYGEKWASPADVKDRLIARGCVLIGKRQS